MLLIKSNSRFLCLCLFTSIAAGQTPQKDVLIFKDGEKLIGHLEHSNGSTVVFKSDMAGEISIDWGKIQELHTADRFAIAEKGVKFGRHEHPGKIPQGTIAMSGQTLTVTPKATAAPAVIPLSDAQYVIDEATFQKALQRPSIFQDWEGAATFGTSLVAATQNSRAYTSAISLSRAIPSESWMEPENRTSLNFSSSYGNLTQPGVPEVKTSIFHADAERDEYFTERLYAFLQAGFDHNYSLGLDLEQTYGAGVGWSVVKNRSDNFDLKAALTNIDQAFLNPAENQHLVGSNFIESYNHAFKHGIVLHEQLSFAPAWNNTNAYSAGGNVNLSIPVFKRIGVTMSTLDTFLNNPSPGFRKNSFQFTTGLTYTVAK